MGFLTNNNEAVNQMRLNWLILDPFWKILNNRSEFVVNYLTLYKPYSFEGVQILADNNTTFKNFWGNYLEAVIFPYGYHDYYEPRTWGLVYKKPLYYNFTWNLGTNTRKPFRLLTTLFLMNCPSTKIPGIRSR